MSKGIPYYILDDMEISDYNDWISASNALDIESESNARLAAVYGQQGDKQTRRSRAAEIESLHIKKQIELGFNPFKPNKKLIQQSWARLDGRKRNKSRSESKK